MQRHVTINTVLEALWGILLQKYNHTTDVVFGKIVSGRNANLVGIETAVGLFINTIPVRVEADAETLVWDLIVSLQNQAIESMKYDFCPLSEIQKRSNLGNGLVQTLIAFENYYVDESVQNARLGTSPLAIESAREEVNYDITLRASVQNDDLHLEILYNSYKYAKNEICALLQRIKLMIQQVVQNSNLKITDLELATDEEKSKILGEFNDTDADYPHEKTVVDLFEEQAARVPGHVAAAYEGQEITYAELNERSNRLAETLRRLGVKPDERVGLLVERGLEMIVGILGTLKAGGAYVPVDPEYPADRIRYTLEDSAIKALLVCGVEAPEGIDAPVLDLRDESSYSGDGSNLPHVNKPDDLAYIIYTSGTTGRPKGVMIEHRGVVALKQHFDLFQKTDENSNVLQFSSISFDAHIYEIIAGLLSGARLCISSWDVRRNAMSFETFISSHAISHMLLPPPFLREMGEVKVKNIITGGSEAYKSSIDLMDKSTIYSNAYGPTEVTVIATIWVREIGIDVPYKVPIGKPIKNKKVYILDAIVIQLENICQ